MKIEEHIRKSCTSKESQRTYKKIVKLEQDQRISKKGDEDRRTSQKIEEHLREWMGIDKKRVGFTKSKSITEH